MHIAPKPTGSELEWWVSARNAATIAHRLRGAPQPTLRFRDEI